MTKMTRYGFYGWATPLTRTSCALLAVAVLPMLAGCEDEDIRAYEAPKSEPYVEPEIFTRLSMPQPTPSAIEWDVPEGWNESPNASSILFAVFEVGDNSGGKSGGARITVTKLNTDGGGVLANINRWRGQVGLEPVDSIKKQPMTLIQAGGAPAGLIDLASPEGVVAGLERMMVVMLPRQQDNLTWYFKMTGPTAALDEQEQAFVSFVESVRFGGDTGGDAPEDVGGDVGVESGAESGVDTEADTEADAGGNTGGDTGE